MTTTWAGDRLGRRVTGPDDGAPLLLGPSLGTTSDMWLPQAEAAVAAGRRVVAFDQLGHGGSAVPPGPYTVERIGRAVLRLADELGAGRFDYAGVSLGGMVGMWLGAHAPDRIASLALICASAHMPPAEGWRRRAATVRANGTASIADAALDRWFTGEFTDRDPYRAMLASIPDEGYAACCEAIAVMDQRPILDRIAAPTLVVAGEEDPAAPPDHGELIAKSVPGARFALVRGAAHLASVERADEVTALLLDHLGGGA